jgi:hypothetical protein
MQLSFLLLEVVKVTIDEWLGVPFVVFNAPEPFNLIDRIEPELVIFLF